jgi:hypothetical protein
MNYPAEVGILVNSGNATFTKLPVPGFLANLAFFYDSDQSISADFDDDGDIDLFVEGGSYPAGSPHRLLTNDGTGSFAILSIPASGHPNTRRLVAGDFDLDGLVDVVENDGWGSRLLWNTGLGFTGLPMEEFDWQGIREAVAGDVDGDGDPDVLATTWQSTTVLYRNLHHQLAWRSLPRVGYPLMLDLYGRANEPYLLAFTLWPANVPIPGLGTLRLDPATLQILLFAAYDTNGHAEFTAPVPNNPGLLGLSIYWQALSFTPLRLGNLEVTTLQAH